MNEADKTLFHAWQKSENENKNISIMNNITQLYFESGIVYENTI